MEKRYGDWIQTWSGEVFYPLDPRMDEIRIVDIAAALSKQCRYGGHTIPFYSVAEHSILVSLNVPSELALAGLLHDSAEAYVSDVPGPIKPFLKGFSEIEDEICKLVYLKYGVVEQFKHPAIKETDVRILADEHAQVMAECKRDWASEIKPLGIKLWLMPPYVAMENFLIRFKELTGDETQTNKDHEHTNQSGIKKAIS